MKSQLIIVQFILVSCSLLATDATDYCDNLLHHCNQFKAHCSPTKITIRSCCDLADLPLSKAPSGVYKLSTKCNCQLPFTITKKLAYCDMETSDGGLYKGILRIKYKPLTRDGVIMNKDLEILMETNCSMD